MAKDAYTFRVYTDITVTKDDVIEYLMDEGFFDEEVTLTDGDEEYTDIITNEKSAKNYEPTYQDYENLAHKLWKENNCEYFGPWLI